MPTFGQYESTGPLTALNDAVLNAVRTDDATRKAIVKVFSPHAADAQAAAQGIDAFMTAVQTQQQCASDFWAPILESGHDACQGFYATEPYADSVESLLEQGIRFSPLAIEHIFRAVVEGLLVIQTRCQRPHGNLKATNVLLGAGQIDKAPVVLTDPATAEKTARLHDGDDLLALGQLLRLMVDAATRGGRGAGRSQELKFWSHLADRLTDPHHAEGRLTLAQLKDTSAPGRRNRWMLPVLGAAAALLLIVVGAGFLVYRHAQREAWIELCAYHVYWVRGIDSVSDPSQVGQTGAAPLVALRNHIPKQIQTECDPAEILGDHLLDRGKLHGSLPWSPGALSVIKTRLKELSGEVHKVIDTTEVPLDAKVKDLQARLNHDADLPVADYVSQVIRELGNISPWPAAPDWGEIAKRLADPGAAKLAFLKEFFRTRTNDRAPMVTGKASKERRDKVDDFDKQTRKAIANAARLLEKLQGLKGSYGDIDKYSVNADENGKDKVLDAFIHYDDWLKGLSADGPEFAVAMGKLDEALAVAADIGKFVGGDEWNNKIDRGQLEESSGLYKSPITETTFHAWINEARQYPLGKAAHSDDDIKAAYGRMDHEFQAVVADESDPDTDRDRYSTARKELQIALQRAADLRDNLQKQGGNWTWRRSAQKEFGRGFGDLQAKALAFKTQVDEARGKYQPQIDPKDFTQLAAQTLQQFSGPNMAKGVLKNYLDAKKGAWSLKRFERFKTQTVPDIVARLHQTAEWYKLDHAATEAPTTDWLEEPRNSVLKAAEAAHQSKIDELIGNLTLESPTWSAEYERLKPELAKAYQDIVQQTRDLAAYALAAQQRLDQGWALLAPSGKKELAELADDRINSILKDDHCKAMAQACNAKLIDRIDKLTQLSRKDDVAELLGSIDHTPDNATAITAWRRLARLNHDGKWPSSLDDLQKEEANRARISQIAAQATIDKEAREHLSAELAAAGPKCWTLAINSTRLTGEAAFVKFRAALAADRKSSFKVSDADVDGLANDAKVNIALAELHGAARDMAKNDEIVAAANQFLKRTPDDDARIRKLRDALKKLVDPTAAQEITTTLGGPAMAGNRLKGELTLIGADGKPLAAGAKPDYNAAVLRFEWRPALDAPAAYRIHFHRYSMGGEKPYNMYLATTSMPVGLFLKLLTEQKTGDVLCGELFGTGKPEDMKKLLPDRPTKPPLVWDPTFAIQNRPVLARTWSFWKDEVPGVKYAKDNIGAHPTPLDKFVAMDGALDKPTTETPVQYVPPELAMLVAGLAGCRLPTWDEWKAANADNPNPPREKLRDGAWADHQQALQNIVQNRDFEDLTWPDAGIFPVWDDLTRKEQAFYEQQIPGFANVKAGKLASPRTNPRPGAKEAVFFLPVNATADVPEDLRGNVAQYVIDPARRADFENALADLPALLQEGKPAPEVKSGLNALINNKISALFIGTAALPAPVAVIGGSALSPEQIDTAKPVPVLNRNRNFAPRSYADVGFRLAFTTPVASKLEELAADIKANPSWQ